MVIVSIFGGLGNQMFQYALGKSISKGKGECLSLDLYCLQKGNLLSTVTKRNFSLDKYRIRSKKLGFFESLYLRLFKINTKFDEKGFFFDKHVIKSNASWFVGYWQSYKYFKNIKNELKEDFYPKNLSKKSFNFSKKITLSNSVSVHIRRGDYTNLVDIFFDLPHSNYYKKAINYVCNYTKNPVFFVFSDDLQWVKDNLNFNNHKVYFVDFNTGELAYEDIYLMSLCKINVIANSSFSWWGAWLNRNASSLVIAPKRWFYDKKSTKDLIPNEWVRL